MKSLCKGTTFTMPPATSGPRRPVPSTWELYEPVSIDPNRWRVTDEESSFRKNAPDAGAVAPPITATTLDGKPTDTRRLSR